MFKKIFTRTIIIILFFLSFTALFSSLWYITVFGKLGFGSIIFTLLSPMKGTASGIVYDWLLKGLLPSVISTVGLSLFYFFGFKIRISTVIRKTVAVVLCLSLWACGIYIVEIPSYIGGKITKTDIYDTEYISPTEANITFPEEKQNLIYILLESMETTYFSSEQDGGLKENLIPELYDLAAANTNFSHNDGIGGWGKVTNTTWTSAAMVAQTAGVPLTLPITHNIPKSDTNFLPAITTINDILHQNGYDQTVMFGSISSYGGKQSFFSQHGVDKILDYSTAIEDKFIPEDYFTWWGFEDQKLFDYAKKELIDLSLSNNPFSFMMLTADTHHIEGYKCEKCDDKYDDQYKNALSCSSRQVHEFIEWIKQQPFYKNTTIVIVGDHFSMNAKFFRENTPKNYTRHVYNCFINPKVAATKSKNRVFTPMDMFPTTLAAIGCKIKGERLGLGTNLFSTMPTLAEEMTLQKLNREINKNSDYYIDNFIK